MKIRREALGPISLLQAEGRLDFSAAGGFQREIEIALAGAGTVPRAVIVDCTTLDYVSSAGLRVLLQAARGAHSAGISFALCALKPAVHEVFELSGFSRLITVHADRATALAQAPQEPPATRLEVAAEATQLTLLMRSLHEFWTAAGLPVTQAHAFELALEEVFMNVVMHATPATGTVPRVELSLSLAGGGVTMTLEDDGPTFDPLSLPPPDVTSGVTERRVGGYGVYLVRQVMDAVSYQRVAARNRLRMSKHISPR